MTFKSTAQSHNKPLEQKTKKRVNKLGDIADFLRNK